MMTLLNLKSDLNLVDLICLEHVDKLANFVLLLSPLFLNSVHNRPTSQKRAEPAVVVLPFRPRDAVEGKNRRRFVCCCYFVAMEKDADKTRDNEEVPSFDNLPNHSNRQYQ
jgi:hypothetical protein